MKNCRGKIRKGNRGSLWTDKEWERRLARRFRRGKKGLAAPQENYVVTEADFKYAMNVLSEFAEMEKGFVEYLRDDKNWMHVGEDDDGNEVEHEWAKADGGDCGCGCGDG
jgi:hypothetical protein